MEGIALKAALVLISVIVNADCENREVGTYHKHAEDYLKRFGYLEQPSNLNEMLSSRAQALMEFQSFVGLPETGHLDETTLEFMKKPRCGVKDEKKRYVIVGSKWSDKFLTYRILNHPAYLNLADVEHEFAKAFQLWSEHTDLTFTLVKEAVPVNITISFESYEHGDGVPFDGRGGPMGNVLAHAFPPPNGRAHFDASEEWTINSNQGKNLYMTAAHEFGHLLGLGHSTVPASLMAPFLHHYDPHYQLHEDDVAGIQKLYGSRLSESPAVPPVPIALTAYAVYDVQSNGCTWDPSQSTILTSRNDRTLVVNGNQYWTVDKAGKTSYPRFLYKVYRGLPGNMDAGFSVRWDKLNAFTYFFKGNMFWRYTNSQYNTTADPGYPSDIQKGFSGIPRDLDAAFVFYQTNEPYIYFFKGEYFWIFSNKRAVSPRPQPISKWFQGLPTPLSGAMTSPSGKTYLIKDDKFYRWNPWNYSVSKVNPPFQLC